MLMKIILFLVGNFLSGVLIGFLIKGRSDAGKIATFVKDTLVVIGHIGIIIYALKFSTFPFIDELFYFVWGSALFTIGFIISIFILGLALGNLIESYWKRKN